MKNPVKKITETMACEAICSCPQNPVIYPTLASIRQTIAQIQKFSHKNEPLNRRNSVNLIEYDEKSCKTCIEICPE